MSSSTRHRPTLGRAGTTTAYRKGCRCAACTAANTRAKQRTRARAKQRGSRPLLTIVGDESGDVPTDTPPDATGCDVQADADGRPWGAMERSVQLDLAALEPPGPPAFNTLKAAALALAREVDNIDSRSSKAPLVKQLVDVMDKLTGKDPGDGDSLDDLIASFAQPLTGA